MTSKPAQNSALTRINNNYTRPQQRATMPRLSAAPVTKACPQITGRRQCQLAMLRAAFVSLRYSFNSFTRALHSRVAFAGCRPTDLARQRAMNQVGNLQAFSTQLGSWRFNPRSAALGPKRSRSRRF